MLQALISSLLLAMHPDTLAIANIANGTMYINPLSTTLGRYPVTMELNPGLKRNNICMSETDKESNTLFSTLEND